MAIGRFQCGIAALIHHAPTGTYALMRRSSGRDFGGGEWECVTGRVDQGESFERAVHREVAEELGASVRIDFIVGTSHFYRGPVADENELLGVKFACSIADRDAVTISGEHDELRWMTPSDIETMLPDGHWLKDAVRMAEAMRTALPEPVLELLRADRKNAV